MADNAAPKSTKVQVAPVVGDQETARRASALSALVQLEQRVRATAELTELRFRMVNETAMLVPYRQAVLCTEAGRIEALSNTPVVDRQSHLVTALEPALKRYQKQQQGQAEPAAEAFKTAAWKLGRAAENLPEHGLVLPLFTKTGQRHLGSLVLFRAQAFSEAEQRILSILADAYAFAIAALEDREKAKGGLRQWLAADKVRRRRVAIAAAVGMVLLLLLPVRLTVLADAEVVPAEPFHLRAQLDGVVDQALVSPGEAVAAGQVLVEFDKRDLENRLALGERELAVSETELQRVSQAAVVDPRAKAQLAVLEAQRDEKATEVQYLQDLLSRAELTAPIDGIAIFEDREELVGQPVQLEQRVMTVAAADAVALELWLGTADAIPLETGSDVALFLNVTPDQIVPATLARTGLLAEARENGQTAYRLRGEFSPDQELPQLGLRGVAKLEGDHVPLIYYLLRRPLAVARQWFGL